MRQTFASIKYPLAHLTNTLLYQPPRFLGPSISLFMLSIHRHIHQKLASPSEHALAAPSIGGLNGTTMRPLGHV